MELSHTGSANATPMYEHQWGSKPIPLVSHANRLSSELPISNVFHRFIKQYHINKGILVMHPTDYLQSCNVTQMLTMMKDLPEQLELN